MMNYAHVLILLSLFGVLNNSLQAGPVYAAEWKRGNQKVFLYGDNHNSHRIIPDGSDQKLAKELCAVLAQAPKGTLVLLEDSNDYPWPEDLSYEVRLCCDPTKAALDGFLVSSSFLLRHAKQSRLGHLDVHNIDTRCESILFETGCQFCLEFLEDATYTILTGGDISAYLDEFDLKEDIMKRALNAVPCNRVMTIFLDPIFKLIALADQVSDPQVKSIILAAISSMSRHKKMIEDALCRIGFSRQEIKDLRVKDVLHPENMPNPAVYTKYLKFLIECHAGYGIEAVDAVALAHITKSVYEDKKVIIVAGDGHIQNIEKYFQYLGFSQVRTQGEHAFEDELLRNRFFESFLCGTEPNQVDLDLMDKGIRKIESRKLISSDAFKWILEN